MYICVYMYVHSQLKFQISIGPSVPGYSSIFTSSNNRSSDLSLCSLQYFSRPFYITFTQWRPIFSHIYVNILRVMPIASYGIHKYNVSGQRF